MEHYAGIDVSLEYSSVCVVDGSGKIVARGQGCERAGGADRVLSVRSGLTLARIGLEAGPLSQWLYAAMQRSGSGGRASGDAARARCLQGDAGEERPQRRAGDCATDAAGLVPAGALQVDGGAGGAGPADGAQAAAVEASRRREPSARDFARLRAQGRRDHGTGALPVRIRELVAGQPNLEMIAQALLAAHAVLLREFNGFEKQVRIMARTHEQAKLLMTTPAVGPIVALTYAVRHRRSGAVHVVEADRRPFRLDAEEVSIRARPITPAGSARSAMPRARGALSGRPCHADQAAQGLLGTSKAGRCGSPGAPACARPRWRWRASSP